ncbi:MAG: hypothetical protein JWP27_3071, partial [Flaviaesturariibacter sp.]|nr:hypothetical protein [Flaviaesturariibacter sp.]
MAKPPATRGFYISDRRSLRFETLTMWLVSAVSVIAVVISFFALSWCGRQFLAAPVAPLLPLAVDGFAVACSAGIVRSQSQQENWRERINEWIGLGLALGLSVAGNVTHALAEGSGKLPVGLVGAFAASVPVIVAYGIHVLGRAISKGLSSKVRVDAPDEIVLDDVAVARPTRVPTRVPVAREARPDARVSVPVGARVDLVKRADSAPAVGAVDAPRVVSVGRQAALAAEEQVYARYAAQRDAGEPEMEGTEIAREL